MRVLICGGGIAGLTLALCLNRSGHEVTVVERAPALRNRGYMIDFFGSGVDACERLGLLPDLERAHCPVDHLTFVDGDGNERLSLPYPVLRKRLFDDRHFNFMRGDLAQLLLEKVASRVELRFGTTVESIEQKGDYVRVGLSHGKPQEVDLLVGADGIHSRVRDLAFGNERGFTRFLRCYAAAFVLGELPRGFDGANAYVTLSVPGRQVGVYPIPGGGAAAFFVHRAERSLDDFSRQGALRELHAVYGDMHWVVPELLERASTAPDLYFDTVSQIEMTRWSVGRVVLIGDACQAVSLLAGQGASMAVAGSYILADEIGGADPHYVGNALSRYERLVKPSIEEKQAAGRKIAGWFVPETRFRLVLRDLGLRMSLWPLTSSLMRKRLATESLFRT